MAPDSHDQRSINRRSVLKLAGASAGLALGAGVGGAAESSNGPPECDYLTADIVRNEPLLLSEEFTYGNPGRPEWSPDGERIAFVNGSHESAELFEINVQTGSGSA